jgi:hypothetical protein
MATKKIDTKKIARVYMGVATVAFSVWLVVVTCKLIILAMTFVSSAAATVLHSIPVIG